MTLTSGSSLMRLAKYRHPVEKRVQPLGEG